MVPKEQSGRVGVGLGGVGATKDGVALLWLFFASKQKQTAPCQDSRAALKLSAGNAFYMFFELRISRAAQKRSVGCGFPPSSGAAGSVCRSEVVCRQCFLHVFAEVLCR